MSQPDRLFAASRPASDFDFGADAGVGADLHFLGQLRPGIDHRRGMDFHSTPISLKLKKGSLPSCGAPMMT